MVVTALPGCGPCFLDSRSVTLNAHLIETESGLQGEETMSQGRFLWIPNAIRLLLKSPTKLVQPPLHRRTILRRRTPARFGGFAGSEASSLAKPPPYPSEGGFETFFVSVAQGPLLIRELLRQLLVSRNCIGSCNGGCQGSARTSQFVELCFEIFVESTHQPVGLVPRSPLLFALAHVFRRQFHELLFPLLPLEHRGVWHFCSHRISCLVLLRVMETGCRLMFVDERQSNFWFNPSTRICTPGFFEVPIPFSLWSDTSARILLL